jgi:hypothetical protein
VLKQRLAAEREENRRLAEELERVTTDLMGLGMHVEELNTSSEDKVYALVAAEKRRTKVRGGLIENRVRSGMVIGW